MSNLYKKVISKLIYQFTEVAHCMCVSVCYLRVVGDRHSDAVLIGDVVGAVIRGARAWAGGAATCRVWSKRAQIKYVQEHTAAWRRTFWSLDSWVSAHPSPAMSSERFLAVVMGLSRRRSSGLLLRSLTFCFSLERSFKLGSEAKRRMERGEPLNMIHSFNHCLSDVLKYTVELFPCLFKIISCTIN